MPEGSQEFPTVRNFSQWAKVSFVDGCKNKNFCSLCAVWLNDALLHKIATQEFQAAKRRMLEAR